jgi:hypothetical protein
MKGLERYITMSDSVNRREFLVKSALASAAAGSATLAPHIGSAAEPPQDKPADSPGGGRTLVPPMLLGGTAAMSKPLLAPSQLSFRLGLARTRTTTYPLDSMDFIMMDLERPDGRSRHAHWCAGDLSGRLLEFLSCAEGVDGRNDPRLETLFERILKQRRPSGAIGRFGPVYGDPSPDENPLYPGFMGRLACGLVRYFRLSGDGRALETAVALGNRIWSSRDAWNDAMKGSRGRTFEAWLSEFFAHLYGATKEDRWVELCAMLRDNLDPCNVSCHAHAYMSTLRGLQWMAMYTGDLAWNERVEQNRRLIIENRFETPDGCTPECFPHSTRNEGCSIADWLMLNLHAGLLTGDAAAYENAERIFWNALAFNQLVTGGFGQRRMLGSGYGLDYIEEAWWCCVHDGGMALSEMARHTVTFRQGVISVNFLTPGQFAVPLPGGTWATVKIETAYPTRAEATIEADGVPADVAVKLRVPSCVHRPEVNEQRAGAKVQITLRGHLGHRIEECKPGVVLTYGPLVLVPAIWGWDSPDQHKTADASVPIGYIPASVPPGVPAIKLDAPADADGFVHLPLCPPAQPLPIWSYFDEGPGARTWVEGAAVMVNLKFPDGNVRPMRFTPMCYNTSCLSLFETPVVFRGVE